MKRILVTGGFGFLGGHLVEGLLASPECHVHVVDNLSTSPVPLAYYLNGIASTTNLTYDICSIVDYFSRPTVAIVDHVYHLASPVGPAGVLHHGGNIVREVVRDAYLIMDYCLANNAKLVDVSTSEVYGGGQEGLCAEEMPKIVPAATTIRLEYAVAKLAVETAIINTATVAGLQASIVRPFNVVGPRQSPEGGFVVPRFIRQALMGEPLTVFGDGTALRAFTHVVDVANGVRLAMEAGAPGRVYNIGNSANVLSILQLAEKVIEVTGSTSGKEFVDPQTIYGPLYAEANDKFPDARRAMEELGWRPHYDVEAAIRDAVGEYERRVGANQYGDRGPGATAFHGGLSDHPTRR